MHALGMQGPPFRSALRVITEKFLKRLIQAGAHDSADDARAAMDLALLKMRCASMRCARTQQREEAQQA